MLYAGVSTACLYPRVVEEALYDLALAGISHVEIFINSHSELNPAFTANLAQLMAHFEVHCDSLHPFTCEIEPMMLFSNYSRRVTDYLEYCKKYFSAMNCLGAKIFVLHGNKAPGASADAEFYCKRFQMLAELGKSYGITVAQENVARCTSASLDFLRRMKAYLGKDAAFVLDVKQAVRAGEDPMEMLRALKESVVHVHISDHNEYGDCLPLGTGRLQLNQFLKELDAFSGDRAVILELYRSGFSNTAELAANYNFLENRMKNLP